MIKSSGNEVEGYWPGLYAKALKGADIGALLTNVGTAAPAGGAAAPAAGGDAAADDKKKEDDSKFPYLNTPFHSKCEVLLFWVLTGVFFFVCRKGRGRRRGHRYGRHVRRRRRLLKI